MSPSHQSTLAIVTICICVGVLVSGFVFTALSGCSDDDDPDPTPTVTPTPQPTVPPQWRMFRHDYRHTGYAPYPGPQTPTVIWKNDLLYALSVVVDQNGFLYVNGISEGEGRGLFCLTPEGDIVWAYKIPTNSYFLTPMIGDNGSIYCVDERGEVYCIDQNGNLIWRHNYTPELAEVHKNPTLSPTGAIVFGDYNGNLYSVDISGELNWIIEHYGFAVSSSPATDAEGNIYYGIDYLYTTTRRGCLMARDANGSLKWWYNQDTFGGSQSVSIDEYGMLYYGDGLNVYSLNPEGDLLWKTSLNELGGILESTPGFLPGGLLVIGTTHNHFGGGGLVCLDRGNGWIEWIFESPGYEQVDSCPAVARDGSIYFYGDAYFTEKYALVALESDGSLKWSYSIQTICYSSPVLSADGTMYFPTTTGLIAFRDEH
ncbi:PQQ-like beta-propeller repeat protein [bacterium]|nr:PQQ-like beta-propeller repeat protein [bacterium]